MGPIQRRDEHLVRRVSTVHLYAAFLAAIVVGVVPVGIVLPGERSNGEAQLSVKGGPNMPMNDATSQSTSTPSMRLIFEYEGDQVRLISQQAVDVAITGFDISRAAHPGYYVDTQDSDGRTLARVSARDAFSRSTEVFPEQPGQPITRVDVEGARGAFTVVVPVPAGSHRVAVVRVQPAKPDAPSSTTRDTSPLPGSPEIEELATFPLQISR